MTKLRLLYLPLEYNVGDQSGPRSAFEELLSHGRLECYIAFPYVCEARQLGSWEAMLDRLYVAAVEFQPNAIYWHLQTAGIVPTDFIRKVKNLSSKPVICQSTGDSYWKPPKSIVQLGREIDITFLSGTGMADAFRKAGCKDVRLLPEPLDPTRFIKPWMPTNEREFDVVMIANRIWSRNPFRIMDGQKERVKIIRAFEKRFGKKFGLFGQGWEKISRCVQGPIPMS